MKLLKNLGLKLVSALTVVTLFSGCAATSVALSKKDLVVQAKTSTAVFVDPVAPEKRKVYVDVKSGVMEFDRRKFKTFIKEQFATSNDNGYQIVDNPDEAQYQMVAYVLNLEEAHPTAAQQALKTGFLGGSANSSIATGAIIGGMAGNSGSAALMGGLIGGVADTVSGSLVKDVTYMLVCDVQIKEKAGKGVFVRKDSKVDTQVSDAGQSRQTYSEVTNKKEYRTRIVTTANKANLKLEEAQDKMFAKTAYAMAGFF